MTRGQSRPVLDGAVDRYGRPRQKPGADDPRAELLAGLPLHEFTYSLSGISTAVLEGGEGPPIVFLHGPGEYGAKWIEVLTRLVATHRVIAPDLPGHGASVAAGEPLDAHRTIAWLEQLVDRTCEHAPVVVGSVRYRWPLHVIDRAGDDPPLERPEAFIEALRAALGAEVGSLRAGDLS